MPCTNASPNLRAGGYCLTPTLRGAWYLSTFLREEGRRAALTSDTASSIRADRHYLALRPNPEPEMKAEVDRVRTELVRLSGDH